MPCSHNRVYYCLEHDNFFCADCKTGMGTRYWEDNLNERDEYPQTAEEAKAQKPPAPESVSKLLSWFPGPALTGSDDLPPELYCGDELLVLVEVVNRLSNKTCWDAHIIVATESGWDDANGDYWGAWSWSDVSWYVRLDKQLLPPLSEEKSNV